MVFIFLLKKRALSPFGFYLYLDKNKEGRR